jgi:TatD DNase family protein
MLTFAEDLDAVLQRADEAGVKRMVCVGTDAASSARCVEMARRYPHTLVATVGIHPNHWAEAAPGDMDRVRELAALPEVVGIGETGLDYHHEFTPRDAQVEAFEKHIDLALTVRKPLVVHARESDDDVLEVLRDAGARLAGVRHCFEGTQEMAERYCETGLRISLGAAVTRPGYKKLKAAVAALPCESLLIETDCPYQAPHSHAGQRNEPAFILETARAVAEVRGVTLVEIAARTTANALALFFAT